MLSIHWIYQLSLAGMKIRYLALFNGDGKEKNLNLWIILFVTETRWGVFLFNRETKSKFCLLKRNIKWINYKGDWIFWFCSPWRFELYRNFAVEFYRLHWLYPWNSIRNYHKDERAEETTSSIINTICYSYNCVDILEQ